MTIKWQPETRGGYEYEIFGQLSEPTNCLHTQIGQIKRNGGKWFLATWKADGKFGCSARDNDYDLIPVFEIDEVGYYRRRDGSKAYVGWIDTIFGRNWPCVGIRCCSPDDVSCWTVEGSWNATGDEGDLDIVAKWEDADER